MNMMPRFKYPAIALVQRIVQYAFYADDEKRSAGDAFVLTLLLTLYLS